MRLLVAGSRGWRDRDAVGMVLRKGIDEDRFDLSWVLVHGNARGADRMARDWWLRLGGQHHPFPVSEGEYERFGRSAPHHRNSRMISFGVDAAVIFWDGRSPGTRSALRMLHRIGVEADVWTPERVWRERAMRQLASLEREAEANPDPRPLGDAKRVETLW